MCLFQPLLLAAAFASLAACSLGEPFVEREVSSTLYSAVVIAKPRPAGYNGVVNVCYTSDTTVEERDQLASEACAVWGLKARVASLQRWQCKFFIPHLATYRCYDPDMRNKNGSYVDPFDEAQVESWRQSHPPTTTTPAPAPAPTPDTPAAGQ